MAVLGIRKYVNDFQPGKQGYEYTGEWVRLPADEREVRRWIRKCMAELVLMSLLFFLGLSRNNAGSYVFWILLPYICLFLPVAFGWMAVFVLLQVIKKQKYHSQGYGGEILLRRMDYDRGIRRLWRCGLGLSVLSGIAAGANSILVFSRRNTLVMENEICFLSASIGIFVISLLFLKQNMEMKKKVRNFKE